MSLSSRGTLLAQRAGMFCKGRLRPAALAVVCVMMIDGCEQPGEPVERGGPERETADERQAPGVARADDPFDSVPDVAERVVGSVVNISASRRAGGDHPLMNEPFYGWFFGQGAPTPPNQQSMGSGVVVSADGIVLTNSHLVQGGHDVEVTLPDGTSIDGEVVGADPKSDLAVVRIRKPPRGLQPLPLGDSSKLRLGQVVLAVGNPFGVGQTVTMGIVSATGRSNLGITEFEDFIQTDAAVNPGNSGGALVTLDGRVVGINTAILSRSGGNLGISFAIPSNMARPIMQSLMRHGRVVRGRLGVAVQDLNGDLSRALGVQAERGVVIADVVRGSSADAAGVRRGDIVLSLDGVAVVDGARLRNEIAMRAPRSKLTLTLLRGNKKLDVTARLEAEEQAAPKHSTPSAPTAVPREVGLEVAPLSRAIRRQFGIAETVERGVIVVSMTPSGRAARAGLRLGDVISAAGHKPIGTPKQLRHAIMAAGKAPLALLVHRGGQSAFLVLPEG
jgi:Do/DeqQ family serine protease